MREGRQLAAPPCTRLTGGSRPVLEYGSRISDRTLDLGAQITPFWRARAAEDRIPKAALIGGSGAQQGFGCWPRSARRALRHYQAGPFVRCRSLRASGAGLGSCRDLLGTGRCRSGSHASAGSSTRRGSAGRSPRRRRSRPSASGPSSAWAGACPSSPACAHGLPASQPDGRRAVRGDMLPLRRARRFAPEVVLGADRAPGPAAWHRSWPVRTSLMAAAGCLALRVGRGSRPTGARRRALGITWARSCLVVT